MIGSLVDSAIKGIVFFTFTFFSPVGCALVAQMVTSGKAEKKCHFLCKSKTVSPMRGCLKVNECFLILYIIDLSFSFYVNNISPACGKVIFIFIHYFLLTSMKTKT